MILCIDIGNTTTTFGIFEGKRLVKTWKVRTHEALSLQGAKRRSNLEEGLLRFCFGLPACGGRASQSLAMTNAVIISSVVPKALAKLMAVLKKQFKGVPIYVLGENIKAPIKNLYKNPKQVGQDRLVNAYAAVRLYGAPAIVVDFGTAITFDVISQKCEYLGGVIVPGIEISVEALSSRAALLPKIKLRKPKSLLGKDTVNSMLSGIFYGFGSLTDGVVDRLKRKHVRNAKVIATGGHADLIAPYCKSIKYVNKNLTLEGLRLTYLPTS